MRCLLKVCEFIVSRALSSFASHTRSDQSRPASSYVSLNTKSTICTSAANIRQRHSPRRVLARQRRRARQTGRRSIVSLGGGGSRRFRRLVVLAVAVCGPALPGCGHRDGPLG